MKMKYRERIKLINYLGIGVARECRSVVHVKYVKMELKYREGESINLLFLLTQEMICSLLEARTRSR